MNALKCDRCGKLYERVYVPDIRINNYRHPYGDEWVDLCDDCQNQLEKWLFGLSKSAKYMKSKGEHDEQR